MTLPGYKWIMTPLGRTGRRDWVALQRRWGLRDGRSASRGHGGVGIAPLEGGLGTTDAAASGVSAAGTGHGPSACSGRKISALRHPLSHRCAGARRRATATAGVASGIVATAVAIAAPIRVAAVQAAAVWFSIHRVRCEPKRNEHIDVGIRDFVRGNKRIGIQNGKRGNIKFYYFLCTLISHQHARRVS